MMQANPAAIVSIHAPVKGAKLASWYGLRLKLPCFNPRSREGSEQHCLRNGMFQSTLPEGSEYQASSVMVRFNPRSREGSEGTSVTA